MEDYRSDWIQALGEEEGNEAYELFMTLPPDLKEKAICQLKTQLKRQKELLSELDNIKLQIEELKRDREGD